MSRSLTASLLCATIVACATDPRLPAAPSPSEQGGERVFTVVPLGASGGLRENDLSSYLLAARAHEALVTFDAGTLRAGLEVAVARGVFAPGGALEADVPPAAAGDVASWILRERIRAYLISHAHLDHYAGMILNSPDDGEKAIVGLDGTLDALRDHLFNWTIWANFADEGDEPRLGRYRYQRLTPGAEQPLAGAPWTVEAHPLAHAGATSTAFLVHVDDASIVYLGDTGPDAVEGGEQLQRLWQRLAPLIRSGSLRAMMIEVSYPSDRPDDQLFGHLTPSWLASELRRLAEAVAPGDPLALSGFPILVTHVKPLPGEPFAGSRDRIRRELATVDAAGARFLMPEQGTAYHF